MHQPGTIYHAFFQASADLILVVDESSNTLVDANARLLRATGFRSAEILGLALDRLLQPRETVVSNSAESNLSATAWLLATGSGSPLPVRLQELRVDWNGAPYRFLLLHLDDPPREPEMALEPDDFPAIVGQSEQIREVCRLIGAVAKSEATVLIQGESGTGKEIIANAIHAHSRRSHGPFVKVNCAALSETLLESELFGHVKGAFTGAIRDRRGRFKQADGGTLFLDEVGSMSLSGQAKLLRVLQEREFEPVGSSITQPVNVRVVAATNVDLRKAAATGQFRDDLYYRLNVFSIPLPPLRRRKEDLLLLAEHFIARYAQAVHKTVRGLAPETRSLLLQHDWPGNVRELENAMEHAVIVESGPLVRPASLPTDLRPAGSDRQELLGLREKLTRLERQILLDTLVQTNGVKKHAADLLKIDPRNLPYLLRKHRICGAHPD